MLYHRFNLSSRDIEHINQPGSESEVCGNSSQRIRPNGFWAQNFVIWFGNRPEESEPVWRQM
jgi:hypothetical protein